MLSEEFVTSVRGPPLTANTAVAKDVGIYHHTLSPAFGAKATFKQSSVPTNGLAVNDLHIFAAQEEKAFVHVYARNRASALAFVPFKERIRSLTLAGDVLVLGTAEGRLLLWEICTGRLVSTPLRHLQAVSAVVATSYHILSGSDDSNIHVWSLPDLLNAEPREAEPEPERSLSQHTAAVTSLAATPSTNANSALCVSASRDKSCIIWNYHAGYAVRTLNFAAAPLCIALDPSARALFVSSDDGSLFLVEFFGRKPLLGPSADDSTLPVAVSSPFGVAPADAGPASCLGVSYDGTVLVSGHPKGQILKWDVTENKTPAQLANLNAAVSNVALLAPLSTPRRTNAVTVVKPAQAEKNYTLTAQFESSLAPETHFESLLRAPGFNQEKLQGVITEFQAPAAAVGGAGDAELQRENEELWEVIQEQRLLQKQTLQRYVEAKSKT